MDKAVSASTAQAPARDAHGLHLRAPGPALKEAMPALFGLKTITFWQAFVMIILAKILFGRMGPGGGGPGRWRHRHHPMADGEGCRDPETWYVKGGWGKWKYYNEYWKDEGKAAFEKYIEKMESSKTSGNPE